MRIYMDRINCPCWLGACESSFGWRLMHLLEGEFLPGGCMVDAEEDGQISITFLIHDKDGDKVLFVDEHNWADAYNSWHILWERQQTERDKLF